MLNIISRRKIISIFIAVIIASGICFASINTSAYAAENSMALKNGLSNPYPAPAIAGITAWVNSAPLQLSDLKGKVVLLDFWTYSCINCVRTLPYVKSWYNKYHDKGLVIIGVHTPEFGFEKEVSNVKNAAQKYGIEYPIALDNNLITWNNYNNNYWPAQYLIDKNGNVVYQHFGEGDDDVTENNIRFLLGMNQPVASDNATTNFSSAQTPETYLGYERAQRFASPQTVVRDQVASYTFPANLKDDEWALQGSWKVMPDKIIAAAPNAALQIHFNAQKLFMVMGSATHQPIKLQLLLNGKPVLAEKGKDVVDSSVIVNTYTLYEILVLNRSSSGVLQVVSTQPGVAIYTFTFG